MTGWLRGAGILWIALPAVLMAAAPANKPAAPPKQPPAVHQATPAAADSTATPAPPAPGTQEMNQLAFLKGQWQGKIDAFPLKMDITILGDVEKPGETMKFDINAAPSSTARMGIEGKYLSRMSYSRRLGGIRAVIVDSEGHGVEMVGSRAAEAPEWRFASTPDGSPFPFKVRLIPVTSDQIVVNYVSGGRIPLKYEITFNRVQS